MQLLLQQNLIKKYLKCKKALFAKETYKRSNSRMGNAFRNQPSPTRYGALKTPVTEDLLQVGLLFAFGIIAASFIIIIPGIRRWEVTLLLASSHEKLKLY